MNAYLWLLAGVVCAAAGGELFVRGVVGIARWARIPPGIIGATFAAFATSSPEMAVSVTSALAGTPQIALGDALGSNVVNVALILGAALLFGPLAWEREALRRDYPIALLTPLLIGLFASDGTLSRVEGFILAGIFAAWISMVVAAVRKNRSSAPEVLGEAGHLRAIFETVGGLLLLVASGRLIVSGATGIAEANGIDPYIIGSTLVALGTSAPEIATVIVARLKGHDEVGLGTIFGSNIFNGLAIVATAALINPIPVSFGEVATGLGLGFATTLCAFGFGGRALGRARGALLLAFYAAYLVMTVALA